MKGIAGCVVGALVLVVLGGICLGASRLDRQMAGAQHALLTSDYDGADASLQVVERYYRYASRLPWVGDGPVNGVRARRASVKYWQRQYGALAPADRTDPVADVEADNLPLQMIVADSVYRDGQTRAKDRAALLKMLDSSIAAYRTVLSNAWRSGETSYGNAAAYNYEYVVRLRGEIAKGRRGLPPPADERTFGAEGKPEDAAFENEFKRYIPLEKEERENGNPAKEPPPARKG
jgi:hypothetical protein